MRTSILLCALVGACSAPEVASDGAALSRGFVISVPLKLDKSFAHPGDTVTGTVTYLNNTSSSVTINQIVIGGRPPGAMHAGGPYDDMAPNRGKTTVKAGASITLTASRTVGASDPTGQWDFFATYADSANSYHDGPDVYLTVSPPGLAEGLVISSPLQLDKTTVHAGDTLTGSVTYLNNSSSPISINDLVIGGRPPGATHASGPYDDLAPHGAVTTVQPGASVTLTASRTFGASDPAGQWDFFPTWADSTNTYHDGPDVYVNLSSGLPAGFVISTALQLDKTTANPGDTVHGTVTYLNNTSAPVVVNDLVIGGRPPGAMHAGGPYDDMTPHGTPTTVQPGATLTLSASRTFAANDPPGQWDFFATWADGSNSYTDGPDGFVTLSPTGGGGGTTGGGGGGTTTGGGGGGTTTGGGGGGTTTGGGGGGGHPRPSYNTGAGFFVDGGKLYDANGAEFRIRGLNKLHWDLSSPGMGKTHANTERWVIDFNQSTSTNLGLMQTTIAQHIVPMPGSWGGTCDSSTSTLSGIVDTWVAQASAWKTIDSQMILNVANEWGPGNDAAWRDAYINAVSRLRNAGYKATIAVDSGGCGQDPEDLVSFAQAVFNSDPQKNIIFDLHIYGNFGSGQYQMDLATQLDRVKSTGLAVVLGEFGPGRNIGPSPTMITPTDIIKAAEARGFGWMAWAWDDGSDDSWFAMSYNGDYNSSSDLTMFGKAVVEDPSFGLKALARPVTSF